MEQEKEKELEREAAATTETEAEAEAEVGEEATTEPEVEAEEKEVVDVEAEDLSESGEDAGVDTEPMEEKLLTQSQVNEIVGRARQEGRESAMRELYGRYGVSGDDELNEVFGNGQRYYDLDDEFRSQGDSLKALQAENALLKTKVDETRWGDIKYILGGKGLDITPENIEAEIPSHPEWRSGSGVNVSAVESREQKEMPATLRKLGGEAKPTEEAGDEEVEKRLNNLFGM